MGIEPTSSAWKAEVIAFIQHPPIQSRPIKSRLTQFNPMVEGGGFEPPKAEPADLQSAPFGHSGTPPKIVNGAFSFNYPLMSTKNGENGQVFQYI